MNKRTYMMLAVWSLALTLPAWADDVVAANVSTIAVPEGSPWYATIIAAIFPALMTALIWLSGKISMFVSTKLEEVKRTEQGKWYGTAFMLAGLAVRAAETKYGPDTQKGVEKKADAVAWLRARLIAIDPSIEKKTPNLESLLAGLVDAAYADAFSAIAPLK